MVQVDQRFTKVGVEQYRQYHRDGFLVIPQLLKDEHRELLNWAEDLYEGREVVPGFTTEHFEGAPDERIKALTRVHMLHRKSSRAEWGLLLPPVLDVLEGLIGADILALQSMLFYNPPGGGGQGWHQDSHYITTFPDSLIGVWMALEPVDEENGCLWVVPGSNHEPIYPTAKEAFSVTKFEAFDDLSVVQNVSALSDEDNTLSKVVAKYQPPIPVPMNPGDVLFFHSHLLHRSFPNRTTGRMRRAYVTHYCNARSYVPWNHGEPFEGNSANDQHILARGATHQAYAKPKFGTNVQLNDTENGMPAQMMAVGNDMTKLEIDPDE